MGGVNFLLSLSISYGIGLIQILIVENKECQNISGVAINLLLNRSFHLGKITYPVSDDLNIRYKRLLIASLWFIAL